MTRFKLTIEYDGTPYFGWQWQDSHPSVQGAIQQAFYDFCQEQVTLHCAGRTDAGVHARGQVAHVDMTSDRTPYQIMEGVNYHLFCARQSVRILACEEADEAFHARFGATGRSYMYRIVNRRAPLVLDHLRAWHIGYDLDIQAMHDAAQRLTGKHDFTSFRATMCQAQTPVKTLDRLDVTHDGEEIRIIAEARSFLHHQVRNMVGTLSLVGSGKWNAEDVQRALDAKDRTKAGPSAPAEGLYLMRVDYDAR